MDASEIVKAIMKETNMTQTRLAAMIGYNQQSSVSEALRKKSMKVETLALMLDAMGYEIEIHKIKRGKVPDGSYIVTQKQEEQN